MDQKALIAKTGLTTASDYQVAVFNHVATQIASIEKGDRPANLIVDAVAGSGKTTTIVAASKLLPTRVYNSSAKKNIPFHSIFLAFNKSIATELGGRLPANVESKTLNSLGYGIFLGYYKGLNGKFPELKKNKVYGIIRDTMLKEHRKDYGDDVKWLVSMSKSLGIAPVGLEDFHGVNGAVADDSTLDSVLGMYGKYISAEHAPTVFEYVRAVLKASCQSLDVIDFDDQKYFPVCFRPGGKAMNAFRKHAVIIDEAQDLSIIDRKLIEMICYRNTLVVGVGDENQAIYGFRGAGVDSMNDFAHAFEATRLPLSITYRCARNIVAYAQQMGAKFSGITAASNAIDGEVKVIDTYGPSLFENSDMILCRNNAPTVTMAFKLIAAGRAVKVMGRDIGQSLRKTIEDCRARSLPSLVEKLDKWRDFQVNLVLQKDPDDNDGVQRIQDIRETLDVFIGASVDGTIAGVLQAIDGLFTDMPDTNKVILATMHKSKGLESRRVFILDYYLMYKWAKDGWQYTQEQNLDYVSRTRAEDFLGLIQSEGFRS